MLLAYLQEECEKNPGDFPMPKEKLAQLTENIIDKLLMNTIDSIIIF